MFVTACTSLPANYGKPEQGAKVGVILLIDESPVYEHVGTTFFTNESLGYISTTDFQQKFGDEVSAVFTQFGYNPKLIEAPQRLLQNKASLFEFIDFNDSYKKAFDNIAVANELDFIVIVYPKSGPAWPESSSYLSGYGLYSRCMFEECEAYALNYISARIYDTKHKTSLMPMDFHLYAQVPMPEIKIPDTPENIEATQIDAAADEALVNFIGKFKEMLKSAGFI